MTELAFRDDAYLRQCAAKVVAVDEAGIRLDRTPFYVRGGGQPGDSGRLEWPGGEVAITDTIKGAGEGEVLHLPAAGAALPAPGLEVTAIIDWDRRHRLMRMHSCMHLVSAVVAGAVTGGQVGPEKSRLDFDLPEGGLDKAAITEALNALIVADHPIGSRWISAAELDASPELVKTMSVAPPKTGGQVRLVEIPGVDLQACGGTHVARTGEIGQVRVSKIENKGRHNRRVSIVFVE